MSRFAAVLLPWIGCGARPETGIGDAAVISEPHIDRAIDCLRKAKERGYSSVVDLEIDPDLEPIRSEPTFRAPIAEFPRPAEMHS